MVRFVNTDPKYDSKEIQRIIEFLKYPEQSMYCHEDLTEVLIDILGDYVILSEKLMEGYSDFS